MKDAEKKVPVYLSVMDWQIVMAALMWHTENGNSLDTDKVLWMAGKNRALYIVGEIAGKLPPRRLGPAETAEIQEAVKAGRICTCTAKNVTGPCPMHGEKEVTR